MHQNPFSAGAPTRTLLGELTALSPRPLSWLEGNTPSIIPPSTPIDLAAFGASLLTAPLVLVG